MKKEERTNAVPVYSPPCFRGIQRATLEAVPKARVIEGIETCCQRM
jgi:hypothetical protein